MAFSLPQLDFEYDALEPHFDARTMEIHHTKHHASYTKKFNSAIANTELEGKDPEELFAEISGHPASVRNNGGGYYNHALFWKVLSPDSDENLDDDLGDAIAQYFGTLTEFKDEFSKTAASQFGSGWAWLIRKEEGELMITSTPNQDNPLMDINPVKGKPILCLDVWEHAYYLKYQNRRPDYIEAFWNVVNWKQVAENYRK